MCSTPLFTLRVEGLSVGTAAMTVLPQTEAADLQPNLIHKEPNYNEESGLRL